MRQDITALEKVEFLTGSAEDIAYINTLHPRAPFDDETIEFLNSLSVDLRKKAGKAYPEIVTFAFWIRKASLFDLKKRFKPCDGVRRIGKGVTFHIAPSNVPVNFAFSLASALMSGNSAIVRVSNKNFPQVKIITDAINRTLESHTKFKGRICCIRYEHSKVITDLFSNLCDVRLIWGGDTTIKEIRKSPLIPRAYDITFADRRSIAVIDSDSYLKCADKDKIAQDFYNDTFLTDQNACTSPFAVIWVGASVNSAKQLFWKKLGDLAEQNYKLHDIRAIDKLSMACEAAISYQNVKINKTHGNYIYRIVAANFGRRSLDDVGNCGYFFEFECDDIMKILPLCDDSRCQTISYIGDAAMFSPLFDAGIRGVDRIVPVGRTMDFDLIWDGYNLSEMLTRNISVM